MYSRHNIPYDHFVIQNIYTKPFAEIVSNLLITILGPNNSNFATVRDAFPSLPSHPQLRPSALSLRKFSNGTCQRRKVPPPKDASVSAKSLPAVNWLHLCASFCRYHRLLSVDGIRRTSSPPPPYRHWSTTTTTQRSIRCGGTCARWGKKISIYCKLEKL